MTKTLRHILLCIVVSFTSISVHAQNWEFGGMVGASNYHGDLAYNIVPKETHPAFGIHMKYNFSPYWSYRPSVIHGKISGSDANFAEYRLRNLSFESEIWEVNNALEFNFVPFGSRILSKNFSSYATLGLAVFRHNPKTVFNGERYALRDLRTEGQSNKTKYGLIQLAIPFGGGVKYNINKNLVIGFEVAWRKTFTDYLDDVSTLYPDLQDQRDAYGDLSANLSDRSWEVDGVGEPLSSAGDERGDPEMKDFYIVTAFTLTYRLTPIACWPKYKREFLFK
ncbi:MAG: outer membrane beta-barrel protein [Bacteroidia bacterium]|nr:outer membrane beta-barrel protein [Bacteroidia bacterium]